MKIWSRPFWTFFPICQLNLTFIFFRFTLDVVNALNHDFGISDNENSARLHVFQFMDNTKDVVGFNTFTRNELEKKVLRMENAEFHGKSTNIKTAIEHAESVLKVISTLDKI